MSFSHPGTPFPVSGYYGPQYFCDREEELSWLRQQVNGSVPAVIIGIRRLGKTGLIKHMFHHIASSKVHPVFVDLMGTRSLRDMISRIGDGIADAFPEDNYTKVWKMLRSLRPTMTFDPFDGRPQLEFDLRHEDESLKTLGSLLKLLSDQKKKVVLALDEFQEIGKYPEDTESTIRSEMQRYADIRYIFSGSQTHMLSQMFTEGTRPFFGGAQKLYLEKLSTDRYAGFIKNQFEKYKKKISNEIIQEIISWTACHTYYAQYVCNQLFLRSAKQVREEDMKGIQNDLMKTSRIDFFQLRDTLSSGHWKILVAAAREKQLKNPTSGKIIKKYDLGTPRAVQKGIGVLLDKQYLFQGLTTENEKFFQLTDVFLMRWIDQNM